MLHDSLKTNPKLHQDVLEILIYTARQQEDTVRWLQRSRELVSESRKHGAETKALRTEAELGAALCMKGQQELGLAKLDSVITAIGSLEPFRFYELDAYIIAAKRKIVVLASIGREEETLPLARRLIELLDDYEQHPDKYHDGSYREPKNDTKRADYIRFYRSQAQSFITAAYTALGGKNMTEAYEKIEHTVRDATAREHIARYNALQQQMEAERQQARADDIRLQAVGIFIIALLAIGFAIILFRKNRDIRRKNRTLVRQIDEAMKYKELYRLEHQQNTPAPSQPDAADTATLTNEQLFQHINDVIVREQLFLDPKFSRQTIIDRFQLSKERAGAAFAQGSSHDSMTDYVQELRLEHAARLLQEQPSMSITQVASQSGFASAQYFSKRFRQRFGMSPSDYRKAH